MRAPCLALLALVLAGCPKQVERVAGSDDSQIDSATARLEELRVKEQSESLSCSERCAVARQTCEVGEELCGRVEANPDRTDLPPRCVQAREQCAQANGGCTRCQSGG
ncbi:hypothetical protein [Hyalangium sp.]|uniref:hypothetical protein n=1 Tax=Hyalangium sp. TaxID=2028555 RepID=UPI002D44A1D0|nr:hypothetical protein [Hyalangium sp.]HYH97215.1 hypothetical protein [Hyalangium sp.]